MQKTKWKKELKIIGGENNKTRELDCVYNQKGKPSKKARRRIII